MGNPIVEDDSNWEIYRESVDDILDASFEQWSVGVDFSYPIGNRSANAAVRRARLQKERAIMNASRTRMSIVQESRSTLRDLRNARAQVAAAKEAYVLAREQYEAEQIRLDNQRSTTFQVREAQRDMFERRDAEILAITDYEEFVAKLAQVQGQLAQQFGVIWEPPEAEEGALR